MRSSLAVGVILLGMVVVCAGAVAMYHHGIIADETGISGWNPSLWVVLCSGAALVLIGTIQIAQSVAAKSHGRSQRQ